MVDWEEVAICLLLLVTSFLFWRKLGKLARKLDLIELFLLKKKSRKKGGGDEAN